MIDRGTPAFRVTILALFASGLATFALLYCTQPLMPVLGRAFHVGPFAASLSLSVTSGMLAFAMLLASSLSEVWGRKPVMLVSVLLSSLLALLCAASPSYGALLVLRALMGLSLSGLPAVVMAYVAEEMAPDAAGLAMGLVVGGNAMGGMTGRLLAGAIGDFCGWRAALAASGLLGLVCGTLVWRGLPPSRHFTARPFHPRELTRALAAHAQDPMLAKLFLEAFLLMGGFVAVYNFIGYRLLAPPYGLSQATVGLIFSVYVAGIASSAGMGSLARTRGNVPVMVLNLAIMAAGLGLTLLMPLIAVVAGIATITAGFFGAHAVASGWVASAAQENKAQAASLYLFSYYAGSSVVGSAAGVAWAAGGWGAVAATVGTLLLAAFGVTVALPK